jgi:hypothetical protein
MSCSFFAILGAGLSLSYLYATCSNFPYHLSSGILGLAVKTLKDPKDTLGKLGLDPEAVVAKRKEPFISALHCGNMNAR